MSEFGRILTNLGLAYGLMNKEQFVDLVARYAQEKDMSEDKMMALVENLFEELEITHRRRQARQMYEAYEMKKRSDDPETGDIFDEMEDMPKSSDLNVKVLKEIKELRKAIEKLADSLDTKEKGE